MLAHFRVIGLVTSFYSLLSLSGAIPDDGLFTI
nr:MAG TPA: hypothetical protein [Caudoviricetes sp.]